MRRLPVALYTLGAVIAAAVAAFDASRLRDLGTFGIRTSELWRNWALALVALVVLPAVVTAWHLVPAWPRPATWVRWLVLAGPLVWGVGTAIALLARTAEDDAWFNDAPNSGAIMSGGASVNEPAALALACLGLAVSAVALIAGRRGGATRSA
jgi:hypothetical protein